MTRRVTAVALALAACSDGTAVAPPPPRDTPVRKVVNTPRGEVRAYPPHAIRSGGVGPYLLDAPLSDVLHALPEGPRVELLQIGRLADWRIVRAEGGKILIGSRDSQVGFIAVLAPEVARIEGGLEVGASGAQLLAALGPAAADDTARDRLVYRFAALPGVSFFTDAPIGTPAEQAKVTAVLVARDAPAGAPSRAACHGPDGAPAGADIIAAVKPRAALPSLPYARQPRVTFGCFTGAAREALVAGEGELWLVALEPAKPRRLASLSVPGADFTAAPGGDSAVPFDVDGDGRDEVLLVLHRRSPEERAVEIRAHRWENGRLSQTLAERPFVIDRALAAVAGVTPSQIDLSIAVARGDGGEPAVAGYYIARKAGAISELVPLRPVPLRLPKRGGAAAVPDAGPAAAPPDAGARRDQP